METSRIDRLRTRVRRLQLVTGVGFLSAVVGAMISASLVIKLQGRVPELNSAFVALLLNATVSRVWVYAVLPACCFGIARVTEVTRWTFPIGAALTGETFFLAIEGVTGNLPDVFSAPLALALRLGTLVLGVLLASRAIAFARAAAARDQARATEAAQAKANEYAEMLRQAEALSDRREQAQGSGEPPGNTGTG